MSTLMVQVDDQTLNRLRCLAETHGLSVEEFAGLIVKQFSDREPIEDRALGALADDELLEQIVEEAMVLRERRNAALIDGARTVGH